MAMRSANASPRSRLWVVIRTVLVGVSGSVMTESSSDRASWSSPLSGSSMMRMRGS